MIYSTVLLILVPFILYKIILKFLNDKYDIEIPKMESNMIFMVIDIIIYIIYKYLF